MTTKSYAATLQWLADNSDISWADRYLSSDAAEPMPVAARLIAEVYGKRKSVVAYDIAGLRRRWRNAG
jgi:phage regulator Rha-like protein